MGFSRNQGINKFILIFDQATGMSKGRFEPEGRRTTLAANPSDFAF